MNMISIEINFKLENMRLKFKKISRIKMQQLLFYFNIFIVILHMHVT